MTTEERLEALEKRLAAVEALLNQDEEQQAVPPSWEARHRAFVNDVRTGNVLGG
jgi:aminoglycoside phosphotransferase (APT) family kinase protein